MKLIHRIRDTIVVRLIHPIRDAFPKNLILYGRDAFTERGASHDLAARSARGGATRFAGQGAQFAFQIGATLILARLLTPGDFGLVAMVAVIVAFGTLLRDAGLSAAVVQSRTITRHQCAALFTVNILASVVLGVVICALGPAIARFFHRPELLWITVGLGVPLIIEGLATQHLALLRRNMMYSTLVLIQVGFQAAYFVGAVAAAAAGLGYWALVIGQALGVLAVVTLTFFFCRWLPKQPRPGTEIGELLRLGTHELGSPFSSAAAHCTSASGMSSAAKSGRRKRPASSNLPL